MLKGLIVDDERNRELVYAKTANQVYLQVEDWDIVKSFDEFVEYISTHPMPDYISFDNDLTNEHYKELIDKGELFDFDKFTDTGYHCAVWLMSFIKENNLPRPICYVHTANIYAHPKILNVLSNGTTTK